MSNPTYFRNYIYKSRKTADLPASTYRLDRTSDSPFEVANLLISEWFSSVYGKHIAFYKSMLENIRNSIDISMLNISIIGVLDTLAILNCNFSQDLIPSLQL